jgi:hypothetical protein
LASVGVVPGQAFGSPAPPITCQANAVRSPTGQDCQGTTAAGVDASWSADDIFPPYVATDADRRRWSLCHQIATTMSEVCEPDGRADPRFVWYTERQLWASDLPTDDDEVHLPSELNGGTG